MKCYKCGKEIDDNLAFCPNCGADLTSSKISSQPKVEEKEEEIKEFVPSFVPGSIEPKEKRIAALLAIFLGIFGAHNYYLGYKGRGTWQLVLTFTGLGAAISFLWALVEFILILCGVIKDSEHNELY